MHNNTIIIPDNQRRMASFYLLTHEQIEALKPILNIPVSTLIKRFPGMVCFPSNMGTNKDGLEDIEQDVLTIRDNYLMTSNIVGILSLSGIRINICSRFDPHDEEKYISKNYFLMYMLQKVFSFNILNSQSGLEEFGEFNILFLFFSQSLKEALSQGVIKQFKSRNFNDPNIKGCIDIKRQFRKNIPFNGNIAYSLRKQIKDSDITQLIRHTIEYIEKDKFGKLVLSNIHNEVNYIREITPSYNPSKLQLIIARNMRCKIHPLYIKYDQVKKFCLKILSHDFSSFGVNNKSSFGMIINIAWLWEEYLNSILKSIGFKHPSNKLRTEGIKMFEEPDEENTFARNNRKIYPDFYNEKLIIDAKYKRLNQSIGRNDLYQIVTYMHTTNKP